MANNVIKVRAYFLDSELFKRTNSTTLTFPKAPRFGRSLTHHLRGALGDDRMEKQIRVSVLGTTNDAFFCPPDLFLNSAMQLGGEPIFSPPPFAAPCTDGLLILYTLRKSSGSIHDLHGGYILVTKEELQGKLGNEPIALFWARADKPANMASMLKRMGFGETRNEMLN